MPTFQWIPDIPAGVLRNRALSDKLRFAAVAEAKFLQFVRPEPGYGKGKGDTLTVPRIKSLPVPTSGRISETTKIPVDKAAVATVSVTVSEWGRAVEYTNLAETLTHFDLRQAQQRVLKNQLKLIMDIGAADAFKGCKVKYIPTGPASGVFDDDGTPSTQATENLAVAHVAEIRDRLVGEFFAEPWNGDDYICLASTKALRGLKNDPDWEEWHKYTDPTVKFKSEVGRIEGVRFIEVNHAAALSGAKGLNNVLGEALFFGDDAVGIAVVQDPELLVAIPGDHGREKSIAWYGILEFFEIWPTALPGEARIIHVTSS